MLENIKRKFIENLWTAHHETKVLLLSQVSRVIAQVIAESLFYDSEFALY